MIARTWRGTAPASTADAYQHHFTTAVAPRLTTLPGHCGAWLLRRDDGDAVEFLAVTLWDSLDAIRGFAGPDPTHAHVEPEGRAALASFDETAQHYRVAYRSAPAG